MTSTNQQLDLDAIEARANAATQCPEAKINGRQDGEHTWTGSMTHLRCELCNYTRPRGERAEETVALVAEVRRLRARVTELERPAVEKQRNEIRQSFVVLAAQCEQDRDYEGAFETECRLREREEQWKAEDAANQPAVEATAPAAAEDQFCDSEFPGDDTFVGQLCERERGHDGDHEHVGVIAGTRHRRRLVWPATAPAARSTAAVEGGAR